MIGVLRISSSIGVQRSGVRGGEIVLGVQLWDVEKSCIWRKQRGIGGMGIELKGGIVVTMSVIGKWGELGREGRIIIGGQVGGIRSERREGRRRERERPRRKERINGRGLIIKREEKFAVRRSVEQKKAKNNKRKGNAKTKSRNNSSPRR